MNGSGFKSACEHIPFTSEKPLVIILVGAGFSFGTCEKKEGEHCDSTNHDEWQNIKEMCDGLHIRDAQSCSSHDSAPCSVFDTRTYLSFGQLTAA